MKISPETKTGILADAKRGLKTEAIMDRWHVTRRTVAKLTGRQLRNGKTQRAWTEEQLTTLVQGWPMVDQIARYTRHTASGVRQAALRLRKLGVRLPKVNGLGASAFQVVAAKVKRGKICVGRV